MNWTPTTRIAKISELAVIFPGYSPRPEERKPQGKYLLIGGRNINNNRLEKTDKDSYVDNTIKDSFRRAIAQPGDIIVSTLFNRRKLYIYRDTDPIAVVNNSCAIIRTSENNDYIVSYLRTLKGQERFLEEAAKATSSALIPKLSISALSNIQIPLLPLAELQRLGDDHIGSSTTDDLIVLRDELHSKDEQIAKLHEQLNTSLGKEEENESLKNQLTKVTTYYEDRIRKIESQISTNDLKSRIVHGETSKFEFKSSLRWNLKADRKDSNIELAILKTIVAFCNTQGGELLIGVADNHTILGVENDRFANEDKFLLHLRNLITDKIIPSVFQYVEYELVTIDDKRICWVVCKQSKMDVWLKQDKKSPEVFYVRSGPSSTELPPRDAVRYIQEHFQK
ncbi:RNA-binding domain-containing protein [Thermodesulfobacteriota bacterium]